MKQVQLPRSGRTTSQLGFGCAFSNSVTEQQAARILDAAYDAGIRHFDAAPFYLDGRAEAYLGSFLARRHDATITTKYGLIPPSRRPLHIKIARAVLGPAVRSLRKEFAGLRTSPNIVGLAAKASYKPDDAVTSLNRSFALLRRPYVDLFLLHEPEMEDVEHEGFLDTMREQVSAKRIGAIGIGGEVARVSNVYSKRPDCCDVVQFDWNALKDGLQFQDAFQIFFWIFSRNPRVLCDKFAQHKQLARRWSDGIGIDMSDARNVIALMLKSSLITNPDGVTLVYSANAEHIRRNVEIAENVSLEKYAFLFKKMALQETILQCG
jgi:D-threo-aldose 1-dehydrogenase